MNFKTAFGGLGEQLDSVRGSRPLILQGLAFTAGTAPG